MKLEGIKRKINHFIYPIQGELWCLHRVVQVRSRYPSNRELEVEPEYLESLIIQCKNQGYAFVSIDELLSRQRVLFPQKRINITFDDGFEDVYTEAFPIFTKYQIPFTLYLTTGFPDGTADLWWLQLEKDRSDSDFEQMMSCVYKTGAPMNVVMHELTNTVPDYSICKQSALSWHEIQEMVNSGLCTIGSHTVSHPGLTRIKEDLVKEELSESKARIQEMLHVEVKHFSYPHSMQNKNIQTLVKESGYDSAVIGYGGCIRKYDNKYCINRKHIVQP